MEETTDSLKRRTAGTLKWNVIDRVATQLLYAVTGVVLARELSQDDFGLVGAVLIFQAFASLLVDGGFSYALIQRKSPTQTDYSTVLWFNLAMAATLYAAAWAAAPLIAGCFGGDMRLVPLTRVMFLTLVLNASASVQCYRLTKLMDVRMIAVANSLGLVAGAIAGIALALAGAGAWAIVWQSIMVAAVKSATLWMSGSWRPSWTFSFAALRSYMGVGARMMFTSFLNTLFLNIYSFFVGNRVGMTSLGYYTQGDKWSKMGVQSLSQVVSSSFLPALSAVQDDDARMQRLVRRMNRFTAYLLFPATLGLAAVATPVFHALFGTKWDPSIALFQMLLVRGVFTVLNSLYGNYILARGHARAMVWLEILRDGASILALIATLPQLACSTPADPVAGLRVMLWGQIAASAITWAATLLVAARCTGTRPGAFIADLAPYLALTLLIVPLMFLAGGFTSSPLAACVVECTLAVGIYVGANSLAGSRIQAELFEYLRKKKA